MMSFHGRKKDSAAQVLLPKSDKRRRRARSRSGDAIETSTESFREESDVRESTPQKPGVDIPGLW
jgi:hypothetical protein